MKYLTEYLWFNTPKRRDLVNITDTIEGLVKKSRPMGAGVLRRVRRRAQEAGGRQDPRRIKLGTFPISFLCGRKNGKRPQCYTRWIARGAQRAIASKSRSSWKRSRVSSIATAAITQSIVLRTVIPRWRHRR